MIGSLCLPQSLRDKMTEAPLVMLEEDLDYRINVILKDYVIDLYAYYERYLADNPVDEDVQEFSRPAFEMFSDYLLNSLERVKKRLGGERYQSISKLMSAALNEQQSSGSVAQYKLWIEALLTSYYDPMYEYQLEKKQERVIFRGNSHQILANQNKILDMS